MKIVINPSYNQYEAFIKSLPTIFGLEGTTIYKGRNEVKVYTVEGIEINVKRFKKPHFINKFIYSTLRQSKAKRAYYNALKIRKKGVNTPEPIAYIEQRSSLGLFSYSFYICIQIPGNKEIRQFNYGPLKGNEKLFTAFAQFTAFMHEKEIFHKDYSPGNILYKEGSSGFTFTIVDINRLKFKKINQEEGCKNLERLFQDNEIYKYIAEEYAKSRNFNIQKCIKDMLEAKKRFNKKAKKKAEFKKNFLFFKKKSRN